MSLPFPCISAFQINIELKNMFVRICVEFNLVKFFKKIYTFLFKRQILERGETEICSSLSGAEPGGRRFLQVLHVGLGTQGLELCQAISKTLDRK